MIDLKELRCGNWVKCPKGLAEVKVIDSRTCDILTWPPKGSDWCGKTSDLQPIPLTDAVLEACGAGTDPSDREIVLDAPYYEIDDIPFRLDGNHQLQLLSPNGIGGAFLDDWWCRSFQYLHQLQNLYFALTGKELEIDEAKLKAAVCHATDGHDFT